MLKAKPRDQVRDEIKELSASLAAKAAKAGNTTVTIRLKPEMHKALKMAGAAHSKTASSIVEEALKEYLAKLETI